MTSKTKNTLLSYFKYRTKETCDTSTVMLKQVHDSEHRDCTHRPKPDVITIEDDESAEEKTPPPCNKILVGTAECTEAKSKPQKMPAVYELPYYLDNFLFVIKSILEDNDYKNLFNENDMEFVDRFRTASGESQSLYVRLFQRNHKWLRESKIKYPEISENLGACFDELMSKELICSAKDLEELSDGLQVLSVSELKTLAKDFKLKQTSKREIIKELLTVSKHCKPLFHHAKSVSDNVMKRVKHILGQGCYKLASLPRRIFIRILLLFNLPVIISMEDDPTVGQTKLLLLVLKVNIGEVAFPDYEVFRKSDIFHDRDDLIRYEEAKVLEYRLVDAISDKDLSEATKLSIIIRENYETLARQFELSRDVGLPSFLRRFTAGHVYVRSLTHAVDVFQKKKEYAQANEILTTLLEQKLYCQDHRGRWWDRLALNLDKHLRNKPKAMTAICKALDEGITGEHYISLLTRGHSLSKIELKKGTGTMKLVTNEMPEINLKEAPKVEILGKLFNHNTSRKKSAFVSQDTEAANSGDTFILSVEELALQHYREKGYKEGIHGEGGTTNSLYGLLFWDIIYKSGIPDVFLSPYQSFPLDIKSDYFYRSRSKDIKRFLSKLQKFSEEDLSNHVKEIWDTHNNKASLVAWDLFTDIAQIQGLVNCIGSTKLAGICKKLATDYRTYKSGAPDLLVWDPNSRKFKFVEVKGPGDRLSVRQRLWVDFLLRLEIDVEVCHVKAVGAKRIKRESDSP